MGRIVALIGPSGTGKTTVARALLATTLAPRMVTSFTTREHRDTDLPGEYEYINARCIDSFESRWELLWRVQRGSTYYATTKSSVTEVLEDPIATGIMILVPDVIDKLSTFVYRYMSSWSGLVPIYLEPPNEFELLKRLLNRKETMASIMERRRLEQDWPKWLEETTLPLRKVSTAQVFEDTLACVLKHLGMQSPAAS